MTERIVPHIPFKQGHVEAKKLLHDILTHAVQNPDDDALLQLVFDDPEGAVKQLGDNPCIQLTSEDVNVLKKLGKETFKRRFAQAGGHRAMEAIVNCLERMDMPETTR